MLSREDRFSRHVFVQREKLCFHQKTELQIRAKPQEHLRSANLSRTLVGICMIVSYSNTNVCMKHTTHKDYHPQKKYDCPQTTINLICQNKLRLTFLLARTVLTTVLNQRLNKIGQEKTRKSKCNFRSSSPSFHYVSKLVDSFVPSPPSFNVGSCIALIDMINPRWLFVVQYPLPASGVQVRHASHTPLNLSSSSTSPEATNQHPGKTHTDPKRKSKDSKQNLPLRR